MTGLRVLIVEDDPRIADLHRRFTGRIEGFEVVGVAADQADALDQSQALQPDLILLDLYLPDGNGLDLLHDLRAAGQAVDAILITAARDAATLQGALRGGAFDYIIKPVVFERFADALVKYRAFSQQITAPEHLDQRDVDRLLRPGTTSASPAGDDLPKGVDPLTLRKVVAALASLPADGLTAEDLSAQVGVSRSTARRYLEYLVGEGALEADVAYGGVGRPQRRYRRPQRP